MNADTVCPKRENSRLSRIRTASRIFQSLIGLTLLSGVYYFLAFLFHWPFFTEHKIRIFVAPGRVYDSPTEIPPDIFDLWLVKMALAIASMGALFALFQLYARGILFSARNVQLIRFFGYWLILDWFVDFEMQDALHPMASSMTTIFVGLIIILLAWIMDEGRKLQEEQELTV